MSGFAPGITEGTLQSRTVALMRGPASGRRLIRSLRCFNSHSGSQTVALALVPPDGGEIPWIEKEIAAGETYEQDEPSVLPPGWMIVGRTVSASPVHTPIRAVIVWADHR